MSWFSKWFGRREETIQLPPDPGPQNRAFEEEFWSDVPWVAGVKATSGEAVNYRSALGVPTALRCGLVIADGVASVPCKLMKKDPKTGKREEAIDHPLYWLLKRKPSPVQNTLEFRETLALHCVFTGNAFAYKNIVRNQVRELIVIPPHYVEIKQLEDYSIEYRVTGLDGSQEVIPPDRVWHMRGPSWDGFSGLDMVFHLRNALGLAMATERAHASRFGSGVQTTGLYSVNGSLDEVQHKRLTNWIKRNFSGPQNSGAPLVLDRDARFTPTQMTGVDAEHVNTRMLQIEEICTGFGVKPIMVGHSDKSSTYASAEQMFLAHAVHTIRPWHRRFEASMNAELLTEKEVRDGYYFKFVDTELLRGSAKDRADYYMKLFQIGGLSPNDVAGMEDMEGIEAGNMRYRPANVVPITEETNAQQLGTPAPDVSEEPSEEGRSDQPTPAPGARMNIGRVLSAENENLIRAASGNLDTVLQKLDAQDPTEGTDNEAQ